MFDWLRRIVRGIIAGVGVDDLDDVVGRLAAVLADAAGYAYPVPRRGLPAPAWGRR